MRGPRPSLAQWVGWGEETQGNGVNFAATKEQEVSRMLTINLNDVEKELNIR